MTYQYLRCAAQRTGAVECDLFGSVRAAAKEEFSNSNNSNLQKWKAYVKGNEKRQEVLREALRWVSQGDIDGYMAKHRRDTDIKELSVYFRTVIDWIDGVFMGTEDEVCGRVCEEPSRRNRRVCLTVRSVR